MIPIHQIIFFVHNEVNSLCHNINSVTITTLGVPQKWLVDTGATLSAVRCENLIARNIPYHNERICIRGIGGNVHSDGYVYLKLLVGNTEITHKFYVFKNLPCRTDGILGQDFLSKYNCILNFELNTLSINTTLGTTVFDLEMGTMGYNNYLILPPRSESLHYVETCVRQDCIIFPKELCEGIFLASALVSPRNGKIPLKVLNTRNEEVKLSFFTPTIDYLYNYDICNFDKNYVNADRVKRLFQSLQLNHLNLQDRISIENICAKYADVFYIDGDKLGVSNVYQQTIHLKDNVMPVYVKPYRLPKFQKAEIDRQINKMLNEDIIEECQSEWSSPLLLVPKKSEGSSEKRWRVVVDYRKLNERIQDDKFPLPNINDILDALSGSVYFSHLDLTQSYYQLELKPESRKYTAFTTDRQYQLKRLPMGLKISPSAFSRAMTVAMSGLNYEKCLIYLDDLVCFGRNISQHNKNLMDIFERLRRVNLKLNPGKCQFLKKELLYLGHVISGEGISPDPQKTKVIQNYPKPCNSDEVKRFIAFANYYRKFIPHFAEIAIPLNKLCRKGCQFIWSDECDKSFLTLKNSLINPPILQYPDFSQDNEYILHTDASGVAIGSMLCNKNNLPIAYASRALNKSELNYPTIEKELLAIVWSVRYFRPYLFGKTFTIKTDHRPLVYLFNINSPSSRLLKFRLSLDEYDYKIEYVKGADNVAADALSRIVMTSDELKDMNRNIMNVMTRRMKRMLDLKENVDRSSNDDDNDVSTHSTRTDHPKVVEMLKKPSSGVEIIFQKYRNRNSNELCIKHNNFLYVPSRLTIYIDVNHRLRSARDAFVRDLQSLCKKINVNEVYIVKNNDNKCLIEWLTKEIKNNTEWSGPRLCIINKKVYRIDSVDDRKVILNDFHLLPTSGHAGVKRMLNNIKRYYFWPNITNDVKRFVKKCDLCQKQKHSLPTKQPMEITSTAKCAFDKVYLDIVGPLEKDYYNKSYILTIQCELSKYVEAHSLENKDSCSVARSFVENFILRYGIPREICTDRGTEFISKTMSEVCKLLHINQLSSTAYHHQTLGSLENSHKSLNSFLRIQTDNSPRYWSDWLQYWCFSYNTTVHSETKYSPYELVFGKKCNLPSNLKTDVVSPLYNTDNYPLELKYRLEKSQLDARQNLINSKHARKSRFDSYVNPIMYKKGDLVLVKNESGNKLSSPVYLGPYQVIEDLTPNVKILKNNKEELLHKNRTKLYTT